MDTKDRRSQNHPPAAHASRAHAPDLVARLLYRDGMMLVIDKPAGIPVHRGPQSATFKGGVALEDYFDVLRFGLPRAPALAHRLVSCDAPLPAVSYDQRFGFPTEIWYNDSWCANTFFNYSNVKITNFRPLP